jgi:acetyl esterase/lipase
LLLLIAAAVPSLGQRNAPDPQPELLWPEGAPGAVGTEDVDKPSLTAYIPQRKTGMSVVVCPGGGYGGLAIDHEGKQIAQWLNSQGIAAFVLKYRLGPRYHHPTMINDAHRALRTVRFKAQQLGLMPNKVGIWGFSAGGHLASTAATHFDDGNPASTDLIERASSRPDFAILAYPVLTFTIEEYVHKGSRRNLLGENPDPKLVELLSNEKQVSPRTPPTFLFHTNEDTTVSPENSILFYMALRKAGVPVEMHIYERGRHGLGLAAADYAIGTWPARLADWLQLRMQ